MGESSHGLSGKKESAVTLSTAWRSKTPIWAFQDQPSGGGARRGSDYVASLRDNRQVWYDGRKIDVVEHSATRGIIRTLAALYDQQHADAHCDAMTFVSPDSGHRVSRSYQLPKTRQHLTAKWKNSHRWMELSLGQLPRLPDFMANVVVGLYDYRHELGRCDPRFERNVEWYLRHCRENDLAITHALGDPQIDRSSGPNEDPDMALRVLARRPEGIVVRGAKQLATLAPAAHEVLIYMSPSFALRDKPECVAWFALPIATPGLLVLCREQLSRNEDSHIHPLANTYDEQDAMLFFDDVLVPWERVFLLDDARAAFDGFFRLNLWSLYVGQIRFYHRLRFLLTVGTMCAEAIGTVDFRETQDKLGELACYVEMIRLALEGMHARAIRTPSGLWAPDSTLGPDVFAAQVASRATEIVRAIAASGIVMQPSEADLRAPELRQALEKYMRGKGIAVDSKARLFRLAWDLTSDSYGMRQEIYETWNRGDVVRNRIHLYKTYDLSPVRTQVEEIIARSTR
ncbi:MAG: 4-hydroxyphenylacetate 3-monooxygenase [Bradyrhizobium sp.]|jgi:aromatic ring hydroxylase|nr:4-hydroxyphenylacetate 3-monooxygenase [Bradyrhizobium sp.]